VDLDTLIITVFCEIDDEIAALAAIRPIRQRGPAPRLHDSEVLTMEVVGEYLKLDTDVVIFQFFWRHYAALFPALRQVHRTTFARQAANLWVVKERIWKRLLERMPLDPTLSIVDSVPVAVCRFGHAPSCRRFRGVASFGQDVSSRATFYGLRCHLRVSANGVVLALSMAPANVPDAALVPELAEGAHGMVLGDRAYWDPRLQAELAPAGIQLVAPFRKRSSDPTPDRSRVLNRVRRRIETTAGQLVEQYQLKRVWARDLWHLTNRLLRKVLSHTLAAALNFTHHPDHPLQISRLITD